MCLGCVLPQRSVDARGDLLLLEAPLEGPLRGQRCGLRDHGSSYFQRLGPSEDRLDAAERPLERRSWTPAGNNIRVPDDASLRVGLRFLQTSADLINKSGMARRGNALEEALGLAQDLRWRARRLC